MKQFSDLMAILGPKRVLLFFLVFGGLLSLALFNYAYLIPQTQKMEKQYYSARRDISAVEDVISGHKTAFEAFSDRRSDFDKIVEKGFFQPQRRLELAKIFTDLQDKSGVLNVRYDVLPGEIEDFQKAQDIEHRMMKSEMKIEVDAFMDEDVIAFIKGLENDLPGHVKITSLSLRRRGQLDQTALEQISEGNKPLLVQAEIGAEWRNLVPLDSPELMPEEEGQ